MNSLGNFLFQPFRMLSDQFTHYDQTSWIGLTADANGTWTWLDGTGRHIFKPFYPYLLFIDLFEVTKCGYLRKK